MLADFSSCKLLSSAEIVAEELAVAHKLNFSDRALMFAPDLVTEEYRDTVLARKE